MYPKDTLHCYTFIFSTPPSFKINNDFEKVRD